LVGRAAVRERTALLSQVLAATDSQQVTLAADF
jgi:hypothetical protein